jgi:hypothetical protein
MQADARIGSVSGTRPSPSCISHSNHSTYCGIPDAIHQENMRGTKALGFEQQLRIYLYTPSRRIKMIAESTIYLLKAMGLISTRVVLQRKNWMQGWLCGRELSGPRCSNNTVCTSLV